MSFAWQDVLGYIASALVVTSLAMTSVVRLRLISLIGSFAFIGYALLIESVPIVITNTVIAGLNIWFLSRELGGGRDLGAVVVPVESPFLADFLASHADEIKTFQPEFETADTPNFALVLTRDGLPAGVVLGDRSDHRLDITLDYVMRSYRDSRLGNWLYGDGARIFRSAGIGVLASSSGNETHSGYLERVGFEYDADTDRWIHSL